MTIQKTNFDEIIKSTKFVQRLHELNKGKHMLPEKTHRVLREGSYETMQGYTVPYSSIPGPARPYSNREGHTGP